MKCKLLFAALAVSLSLAASLASAQSHDYLTDEEIELVRDAQQIDRRIEVLVHAIDRRFAALKIDVGAPLKKEGSDWGTSPEGTRLQLLYDIKRILRKAVEDIDNLSERPDSMVIQDEPDKKKKAPGYNDLFPKAVRALAAAAERYKSPLKAELDRPGGAADKGSILDALDMCSEITAALEKLPKSETVVKKKGT